MSNNGNTEYNNLFSSLISNVKSYIGTDPLLPWLRGIKKMKETLPPHLLKEKLPRFLQKCSETFIADCRYSNDLRYLRVWLQLMDFVDNPKSVLRTMEKNRIGMKKSLFYQAYALYYEKMKRFDAAEKIYHLGVQNLAEPADELQKSYEQFLHRLERHNNKRVQLQGRKTNSGRLNTVPSQSSHNNMPTQEAKLKQTLNEQHLNKSVLSDSRIKEKVEDENRKLDRFVDDAIVNSEDARHHGLVEPTINTKEAMNAINSMFREPLNAGRTSKNQSKVDKNSKDVLTVFTDENLEPQPTPLFKRVEVETNKSLDESFEIYVDGEEANDEKGRQAQEFNSVGVSSNHAPVFARPNDLSSESVKDPHPRRLLREDTVVSRFVGSTISDEPEVENVWHHGLVDPTVNLKEAMEDINNMFGKPIEFARKSRSKKHEKAPDVKSDCGEFVILADDEPDDGKAADEIRRPLQNRGKVADMMSEPSGFMILADDELDDQQHSSSTGKGSDLFEQTLCTKEAMDEINKLFAMPMDF
ncbi:hypothetical protein ACS0TY_028908 [Phlomoides rotata]